MTEDSSANEPTIEQQLKFIAERVSDHHDCDIFVYSGEMRRSGVASLIDTYMEAPRDRSNCLLLITTPGGDPDAAYILARLLKRSYDKFSVGVFGVCKSAGTLVALGADELVISTHGELGPLDIQFAKDDAIGRQTSGLDIFQAMSILSAQAFTSFEEHFLGIIGRSGGAITTKTAAEIATNLATQLLSPIAAQIEPIRLGETQRAINIAEEYGRRLGCSDGTISKLISAYPSHGFVIDIEEAETLFANVRRANPDEFFLAELLRVHLSQRTGVECIRSPYPNGVLTFRLSPQLEIQEEMFDDEADDLDADAEEGGGDRSDPETDASASQNDLGSAEPSQGSVVGGPEEGGGATADGTTPEVQRTRLSVDH